METIVYNESPLAEYLRDEGEAEPLVWESSAPLAAELLPDSDGETNGETNGEIDGEVDDTAAAGTGPALPVTPDQQARQLKTAANNPSHNGVDTPPPSPPSPSFAPVGRPMVRKRFRNKIPNPLRVDGQRRSASLSSTINNRYSRVLASTISRADNTRFLEKFRYTIITSHLLGAVSLSQRQPFTRANGSIDESGNVPSESSTAPDGLDALAPTTTGVVVAVAGAFVIAWAVRYVCVGGIAHLSKKRFLFGIVFLAGTAVVVHTYLRQQWLRYVRQTALTEVKNFVTRSLDFDSAASAAISFIKEVELVSRGYRISAPLPPISRMDDRSQMRRCMRIRKAVCSCFQEALPKYIEAANVVKELAEPLELEMYYHVHDITDFDISDAMQGYSETEFEDASSIRTMTILAARFHTVRKIFLCGLLALEASGDKSDHPRWTTAVERLRKLSETSGVGYGRLQNLLGEAETFPQLASPRSPLTPGRERLRPQLGKLNSLSTGIRGLQAKLALLRELSDRSLNEADDITELGPSLLSQYDSIGQDLRQLVQAWEEGRLALASGIGRNEKRLSSINAVLSPTTSLSGITTVGEDGGGTAEDALLTLTGGSPLGGSTVGDPEEEAVFEAVSLPPASKRKSLLPREERIAKMKEERERRAEAREQADASRGMLRELEMVINLRPKGARSGAGAGAEAGGSPLSKTAPTDETGADSS